MSQPGSKRLFFVHIPKCAGSTIGYLMRFQFGLRAMNVRDLGDSERVAGESLRFAERWHPRFVAATGHGLHLNREIKARYPGSFWFTILREPKARYVSHHAFLQQKMGHTESLASWAERGAMRNLQVRWLAGEENLDKAIDAAENVFDLVGRIDEFERSMAMVAAASGFDLRLPTGYKANTTKPAAVGVEAATAAAIEANNDLDLKLWDRFSKQIWPQQVERLTKLPAITTKAVSLGDRGNAALNLAWRSAVYIPALKIRPFI